MEKNRDRYIVQGIPGALCTVNGKEMILRCLPTFLDFVMHANGADKLHKSTNFPDFTSF